MKEEVNIPRTKNGKFKDEIKDNDCDDTKNNFDNDGNNKHNINVILQLLSVFYRQKIIFSSNNVTYSSREVNIIVIWI